MPPLRCVRGLGGSRPMAHRAPALEKINAPATASESRTPPPTCSTTSLVKADRHRRARSAHPAGAPRGLRVADGWEWGAQLRYGISGVSSKCRQPSRLAARSPPRGLFGPGACDGQPSHRQSTGVRPVGGDFPLAPNEAEQTTDTPLGELLRPTGHDARCRALCVPLAALRGCRPPRSAA
jgi:hypothetical protein